MVVAEKYVKIVCMTERMDLVNHGKSEPTSLLPYPITTSISFEEQQCAAVMT